MFLWLLAINNPFPTVPADANTLPQILNIVLGIAGALSLLTITYGGFKYVISRGDPQSVNKAKDTILYAVIGLVVTLSAAAIVNFVLKNVFG